MPECNTCGKLLSKAQTVPGYKCCRQCASKYILPMLKRRLITSACDLPRAFQADTIQQLNADMVATGELIEELTKLGIK